MSAEIIDKSSRLLLTLDEAAGQLHISRSEMKRCIARGEVRAVKIGRLTRVRPGALLEYVERLAEAV